MGDTEVDEVHAVTAVGADLDEDVVRLDVCVDHADRVRGRECIEELADQLAGALRIGHPRHALEHRMGARP